MSKLIKKGDVLVDNYPSASSKYLIISIDKSVGATSMLVKRIYPYTKDLIVVDRLTVEQQVKNNIYIISKYDKTY